MLPSIIAELPQKYCYHGGYSRYCTCEYKDAAGKLRYYQVVFWVFKSAKKLRLHVESAYPLEERPQLKNRKPRPTPINQVWGIDLTGKQDLGKNNLQILAVVDHGSRANLYLQAIPNKTSMTLLRCLLDSIEKYGKPMVIRTDNESIFTSWLFRFGLWFLGIKHQRTDIGCPWMNGRIERFFGTLKQKLNQIDVVNFEHLNLHLKNFRFFYNHIRTHANIEDRTPAEVWTGKGFKRKAKYCSAWGGLLQGYWHPPD